MNFMICGAHVPLSVIYTEPMLTFGLELIEQAAVEDAVIVVLDGHVVYLCVDLLENTGQEVSPTNESTEVQTLGTIRILLHV